MTQEEFLNRQSMYAFLSRTLLQELDAEVLGTISANPYYMSLLPNFQAWEKRQSYNHNDLILRYLNPDFVDVSVIHVVPYESFYVRDDAMIESGGDNTVIDFYNEYDFRVELGIARAVSPDHIGIELEFIFKIVSAQLKAFEANDDEGLKTLFAIQERFMSEHLLQFAPMYLMAVATEAKTPFYHDVAKLALEFVLSDYEYITESLDAKN